MTGRSSAKVRPPSAGRDGVVNLVELLAYWGYGDPETIGVAREALILAGRTREGKTGINRSKSADALSILREQLILVCNDPVCQEEAGQAFPERLPLPVMLTGDCEICGGRQNQRDFRTMIRCLVESGIHSVLVVGGSPATRDDMRRLAEVHGNKIEFRFVDGVSGRSGRRARSEITWAELIIIWVGELKHKVSGHYQGHPNSIAVISRGVAMLAQEVIRKIANRNCRQ